MNLQNIFKKLFSSKPAHPLILVTGSPKTGTTAVYHSIREALPDNTVCLFEPENRNLQLPETITSAILVKSFVPKSETYDHFPFKILITRDPRDHIISQMLYRPYNIVSTQLIEDPEERELFLEEMLALLEKKENDPPGVSVREIYELQGRWTVDLYGSRMIKYFEKHPDVFRFKYEDYIDANFEGLEKYLGFSLKKVDDVPQKRVIRSKAYGNWKDWFTPADVEYYRPLFTLYMNQFGYQDDWKLNENPFIDPAISSQYVRRIILEAREVLPRKEKNKNQSR